MSFPNSAHRESSFDSLLRAHGANPEKLYAALGLPLPKSVTDFSTNASVVPWMPPALDWPALVSRYPDDECLELRRLVAEREGVSIHSVLFTNGSNEALYLLASYLSGRRAAVLQPAYSEYARALGSYGVETADLFSLADAGDFDAVFLSNPCNPTGAYIPNLPQRAREIPQTLFIVDEAYSDFLLWDERPRWQGLPNVILLRSLTKFYHLSGARIGYVIAPEDWIERLKARQPTWSVNAPAQALALAFLRDEDFARRSLAFYREETPRFVSRIEEAGFPVRPSRVHFFLIQVEDDESVLRGLLRRGLVARHTRNFRGLDGHALRVATRTPEGNQRLIDALRELREEGMS
ncbi:MAG: pyridoxal phosphate-dependent class II aminotransferase [Synergistaceae bacterium]|nr:pyridoxal phosphate-dependent class II aminotransferase [Synergistaceae bacterium]